jgi:hypothetical protein
MDINNTVAYLLKARIVETAVAREQLCKHIVPVATKEYAIMGELLEVVFSVQSVPRLYNISGHGPQEAQHQDELTGSKLPAIN